MSWFCLLWLQRGRLFCLWLNNSAVRSLDGDPLASQLLDWSFLEGLGQPQVYRKPSEAAAFLACVHGNAVSAAREEPQGSPRAHIRPDLGIGHWCPEAVEGPDTGVQKLSFLLVPFPESSSLSCVLQQDWALPASHTTLPWPGWLLLSPVPSPKHSTPPQYAAFPNDQTKLRAPAKLSQFFLKTLTFDQN